jgi:uncharacterized repeat protein (TIGR02543 family)
VVKKKKMRWKTFALFMMAAVIVPLCFTQQVYADDITINAANFPDENFRSYVSENIDADSSGSLSVAEISNTTNIDVQNKNISSLQGIEYFTSLATLNCRSNNLTSLDVSQCPNLTELDCYFNSQLTNLTLGYKPALTSLYCFSNNLMNLDVSQCTALEILWCNYNRLMSLDVSQCPNLKELRCYNNQLTGLNMSSNPQLTVLYCDYNPITSLDMSNNPQLTKLYCYNNNLTSLDVSPCPNLQELFCYSNQLTNLDLSSNTSLGKLDCGKNQLSNLDVHNNLALSYLECSKNSLISLDLSANENPLFCVQFYSESRIIPAAYINGKMVVDLANDLGLDVSRISNPAVTGGTYNDGIVSFDLPVASNTKFIYYYNTHSVIDYYPYTYMKVTLVPAAETVTFESNGGSAIEPQEVAAGTNASRPADPAKSGYHFVNWYFDMALIDGSEYDFDTLVTEDITLYAKWEAHILTHHGRVEPTCTEKGRAEYWTCSTCGRNFSDEAGTVEITDLSTLDISVLSGESCTLRSSNNQPVGRVMVPNTRVTDGDENSLPSYAYMPLAAENN